MAGRRRLRLVDRTTDLFPNRVRGHRLTITGDTVVDTDAVGIEDNGRVAWYGKFNARARWQAENLLARASLHATTVIGAASGRFRGNAVTCV